MQYNEMALAEVSRLPGVKDLQPLMARAKFAKALMLEAEGKKEEAEKMLQDACNLAT